jgi:hypothetical protein
MLCFVAVPAYSLRRKKGIYVLIFWNGSEINGKNVAFDLSIYHALWESQQASFDIRIFG